MRLKEIWSEKFTVKNGNPYCVYDIAYSSNGKELAATVGSNICIYNAKDGSFVTSLKNHRDTVTSISYSIDGRRFASGSMDKQVIIWTDEYEGILKYSHYYGIKCLQFNPVTSQLVSCTCTDFGIWSPEQESVIKHKVSSSINDCSWSSDGHYLALGLEDGFISLRSRTGEEKMKIDKNSKPRVSVSGLTFNPYQEDGNDTLAVVYWSQSLSLVNTLGKQLSKEISLGFDPLSISYFWNGKYLLISGSNREAVLYSKDGIYIASIGKSDAWVWSCKASPGGNQIAMLSQDGSLVVTELNFEIVQSLYKDRHAFRENMTDVIIHHFVTEEKVRIKCRDCVKKLAVYKNRLAIQLSDRIVIYELFQKKNSGEIQYKVKDKVKISLDCTSLIVCSDCFVVSQKEKLQCYSFNGSLEKEWKLDSVVKYVKIIGGPPLKEQLLVGLENGQVVRIFVNNSFPINVVNISTPVCSIDISMLRRKLAVIDDQNNLYMYDLRSKTLVYQESNASSIAWNTQFEDMLCFSGANHLSIKVSNFPAHYQHLQGFVIGFSGAKVFCLYNNSISAVELSQSIPMYQYMEKKLFNEAYKIACLKATAYDFEQLAFRALEQMELEVAKKAFAKNKSYIYLDFIHSLGPLNTKSAKLSFIGDILAFKNQFNEAAKLFKQAGLEDKAISMYTDLRMFDWAQDIIKSSHSQAQKQVNIKKADWIESINDPRAAAEMYLAAREIAKVIEIVGQYGYIDMLMEVVNQLDKGDQFNLSLCGEYLVKHKQYFMATEVYKKMGDVNKLISIYTMTCQWEEALKLIDEYPNLKQDVYFKYATWLAENDQFVEAQQAFHKAGKISEAIKVLNQLTNNAINEHRFNDASYYLWILSMQCLDLARGSNGSTVDEYLAKFKDLQTKADVYYAYHFIHRYIEEPFTSFFPDVLFNIARFLFYTTLNVEFIGVSKVAILYVLAKYARNLGAYKLARLVYEKLHTLAIPLRFQEAIELGNVTIRGKPFSDAEDLLPLCYRCSTTNQLYNEKGNQCINCRQPFVFSFINFDILPLIEFELKESFSEDDAVELIKNGQNIYQPSKKPKITNEWKEEHNQEFQTLKLIDDDKKNNPDETNNKSLIDDPLSDRISSVQGDDVEFKPILVDRATLTKINPLDLIISEWPAPLKKCFHQNLISDISIYKCPFCHKFFHTDEFEVQVLKFGHCPFCRNSRKLILKKSIVK